MAEGSLDPIEFQIINNNISGIAQEMQEQMYRSAYSTIIRESLDASCAILDRDGRLVGQHVILPLHMGAFPPAVETLRETYDLAEIGPNDAFITNHPYKAGCPHQADLAVISPVFHDGELVAFCCNMAHKSDVGGIVPGSGSGQATEIYQEGIHLPPVRYHRDGERIGDIERIIRENSRTPDIVLGDIDTQVGTNEIGRDRLRSLFSKYGHDTVLQVFERIFRSTEKRVRSAIDAWEDGTAEAEGYLDDDGVNIGDRIRLHVSVTVDGDDITFDFTDSQDQTEGPVNIRPPLVRACCYYALIATTDPSIPNNHGLANAVETTFRSGSVLDPLSPGPVNCYILAAAKLTEMLLMALGEFTPEATTAGTGGGGAIVLGGNDPSTGRSYNHYEIHASAFGARPTKDGVDCTDVHISNCKITPIEIVESEFPVRVREFDVRTDSGGAGRYRGGASFVREYELLSGDARFSKRADRQSVAPPGVAGGEPGATAATVINPGTPEEENLPSKFGDYRLVQGDVFRLEQAGGGGYGDPTQRPREAVLEDVQNGYVSVDAARDKYGVEIREQSDGEPIDHGRTDELRSSSEAE